MQGLICDFPHSSDGKASAYNVGDRGSVPELGRSPGKGNDTPLQYSILENPMDGGAWWSTVHGVAKSQTQRSNFTSVFRGCSSFFFFFFQFSADCGFPGGPVVKNKPASAGDMGSIPGPEDPTCHRATKPACSNY